MLSMIFGVQSAKHVGDECCNQSGVKVCLQIASVSLVNLFHGLCIANIDKFRVHSYDGTLREISLLSFGLDKAHTIGSMELVNILC